MVGRKHFIIIAFVLLLMACTSSKPMRDTDTVVPDDDTPMADDAVEIETDGSLFVEADEMTNDEKTNDDPSLSDEDRFPRATKQWGTSASDIGQAIAIDATGNVYVAGDTWGSFDGSTNEPADWADVFLTKWDATGVLAWTQQLGTLYEDFGRSVAVDSSGNIYVTGWTIGSLDGNTNTRAGWSDIFLAKWNADGTKAWTKQWGTPDSDRGHALAVDPAGNIYVTGQTKGSLDGETIEPSGDVFLAKLNVDGAMLWTKQWGAPDPDYGNAVAVDHSGNIYVAGETWTSFNGLDIFLTKWNADGTKAWTRQWGTPYADSGNAVTVDPAGNIYVTGVIEAYQVGHEGMLFDVFLTKWNADGAEIWSKQWGGEADGRSVTVDLQGNIYVAGTTWSSFDGNRNVGGICDGYACPDVFLTKWRADGSTVWTRQWGSTAADLGNAVAVDALGRICVAGGTEGSLDGKASAGIYDVFLNIIPDE